MPGYTRNLFTVAIVEYEIDCKLKARAMVLDVVTLVNKEFDI